MLCARLGRPCCAGRAWIAPVILRLWLAVFALANLWRAMLFAQQWRDLPALATAFNPVYLAGSGLVWGMGFLLMAVLAQRLQKRLARVTILFMLAYLAHQWANFLLLSRNSEALAALGARALLTGLALLFTGALAFRQQRFARRNERDLVQ